MVRAKCARCGWIEAEHIEALACTVGEHMDAAYSALPCPTCQRGPCHRFEPKAPLGLRLLLWVSVARKP